MKPTVFWLCVWILALSWTASSGAAVVDPASIIGLWRFDEGKGDVAKDSSDNGNDGQLVNGPEWVDGKAGKALQFEAVTGAYVIVPVEPSNTISVVMWALYTGLPSNNPGLLHAQATDGDEGPPDTKIIGIWVENSNMLWGRFIPPGGGRVNLPKNAKLNPDEWFHTAMILDADAGKATQWVNGEVVGEADYEGKLSDYAFLKIGRQGTETWEGIIDEVGAFRVALTKKQIATIVDEGFDAALSVSPKGRLAATWARLKAGARP